MAISIIEDSIERPELFRWFGIVERDFDRWLRAAPMLIHPGLVGFWRRTGGGSFFESETILGPIHPDCNENVLKANELHWGKGLTRNMVLFHHGAFHSVSRVDARRHRRRIATLSPGTYDVDREFETFSEWYSKQSARC